LHWHHAADEMPGMSDAVLIDVVEVESILDLRWRVLRAALPRESARFDGDNEPATRHFAAIADDAVIGCVTILQRPWHEDPAWQLRGMAIDDAWQRRGVGERLLRRVEEYVLAHPHSLQLWCNARVPASGFYQKLGWTVASDVFDIPTAGPHVKMTRQLQATEPFVR
jgi:GNAT superfamily N-acetyltransferase